MTTEGIKFYAHSCFGSFICTNIMWLIGRYSLTTKELENGIQGFIYYSLARFGFEVWKRYCQSIRQHSPRKLVHIFEKEVEAMGQDTNSTLFALAGKALDDVAHNRTTWRRIEQQYFTRPFSLEVLYFGYSLSMWMQCDQDIGFTEGIIRLIKKTTRIYSFQTQSNVIKAGNINAFECHSSGCTLKGTAKTVIVPRSLVDRKCGYLQCYITPCNFPTIFEE